MSHVLLDIAGYALSPEDKEIITHPAIFGVILFTRNYHDPAQLKALTQSIHKANPEACIVVDQEGGRVQRFRDFFTRLPSMREWGERFSAKKEQCLPELKQTIQVMIQELHQVGVQVNLMPVLDVDYGVSQVIGERSFGSDANVISTLADVVIGILHSRKMPAIGKHFPGHGAVTLDSHEHLPTDERDFLQIWDKDLRPYQKLIHQLDAVMPAHVVYSAVDDKPAGFSTLWLQEILRKKLGFTGLIISDDISMKATACFGGYRERAKLAWSAGCDVVSVCNYRDGAIEVLDGIKENLPESAIQKVLQFSSRVNKFV